MQLSFTNWDEMANKAVNADLFCVCCAYGKERRGQVFHFAVSLISLISVNNTLNIAQRESM